MIRRGILTLALAVAPLTAGATCPELPGWQPLDFLEPGDQWLDYFWLSTNLPGHSVLYEGGSEHYLDDGSYRFDAGEQNWTAPGYVFYQNGARCIDYPEGPRVDFYIISRGRLMLVTQQGERFVGLISN